MMSKIFVSWVVALPRAFLVILAISAVPSLAQEAADQAPVAESLKQELYNDTTVENAAQAPAEPEIVATIGNKIITIQELTREFANRGTNFGPDLTVAQQRLRDTVIAEYWVDQNFAQLAVRDRRAAMALGEARRQVLFEVYAQSTFPRAEITENDIADYAAANTEIFEDRRSYVYQRVLVLAENSTQRDAVRQALEGVSEAGDAPSDFAPFTSQLAASGSNFAVQKHWTSTENLTPDMRTRLWAMSEEDRRVDIAESDQSLDVVILIDAYNDPTDPAQLQNQIVNRIQQDRYAAHRIALAQSIAAPLIGTLPEPVEDVEFKPTTGSLVAAALVGGLFGLVISMLVWWARLAKIAAEAMEKASLGDFRPQFRNHPTFVKFVAIVLALALLVEIVFGVLLGPTWVGSLEVLAAFLGTLLLAAVLGVLIGRVNREMNEKEAVGKLRLARRCSIFFTVLLLVGGSVIILRPAFVVGLFNDLWSVIA